MDNIAPPGSMRPLAEEGIGYEAPKGSVDELKDDGWIIESEIFTLPQADPKTQQTIDDLKSQGYEVTVAKPENPEEGRRSDTAYITKKKKTT